MSGRPLHWVVSLGCWHKPTGSQTSQLQAETREYMWSLILDLNKCSISNVLISTLRFLCYYTSWHWETWSAGSFRVPKPLPSILGRFWGMGLEEGKYWLTSRYLFWIFTQNSTALSDFSQTLQNSSFRNFVEHHDLDCYHFLPSFSPASLLSECWRHESISGRFLTPIR